jgi:hypothetical protein
MDHNATSSAPNAYADPQAVERAEQGWRAFTFAAKAGLAGVVVILILLVLITL